MKTKLVLSVSLVLIFTSIMLGFSYTLKNNPYIDFIDNDYLNFQVNYQPILLLVVLVSLFTSYFLSKTQFKTYFKIGNLAAKAESLKIFGIKKGDSWVKTGLTLSIVISLVTAIFMILQIKSAVDLLELLKLLPWILLFSTTNAFGEEVVFRLGIVSPLTDSIKPSTIYLISSVLFGVPHLAGMPDGLVGTFMAGILGFVLAKSVYETKGLFWAWWIHFLQDVVIISALTIISI